VPESAGKCPVCGCFQKDNQVAVTHGLRRQRLTPKEDARRAELIDQLLAERGGRENVDILMRYHIQEFAELTVHIDHIDDYLAELGTLTKAGRQPAALKTRLDLSARRDQVAAKIRGDSSAEAQTSPVLTGGTLVELAERAAALAAVGRRLVDEEAARLKRGEDEGYLVPEPGDAGYVDDSVPSAPTTTPAPAPDLPCSYCGQACVGPDHEHFSTLHYNDPAEIARRSKEATRVMYHMLGKPSPFL
jgi:hypothetical protein